MFYVSLSTKNSLLSVSPNTCSFIIPLMRTPDALVKNAHGLVRAAYLHLHEIRLPEATSRTYRHGPIDVLPRVRPPQYVVDLLPIWRVRLLYLGRRDGLRVGARRAGEDCSRRFGRGGCDNLEEGAVQGTEPHGV